MALKDHAAGCPGTYASILRLLSDGPVRDCPPVRIASTDIEKEEIYRLRYEVYIEEMRGGTRHTEADSARRQLRDQWDNTAHHFYIQKEGVMVAAGRLNFRRDGSLECENQFEIARFKPFFPNHVCMTSRLVVHPALRGNHLLKPLTCAMYRFGRKQDMRFNFIDCHAQWLPLYSRLGYRLYRSGFNHDKYTYVIPMVLVGDDLQYLERVKSPFASIARRYRSSLKGSRLLISRFPHTGHSQAESTPGDASSWELWHRLSHKRDLFAGVDLLRGMTIEEAKRLVAMGHVLSCRTGDVVVTSGDSGREIFLILGGSFQVQKRGGDHASKVFKILAAGESFGESRFLREDLRPASVKAREDATLLILNAKALDRLVMSSPKVAAKLFRNIARIVARRECDSVRFLRFPQRDTEQALAHRYRAFWSR